MTPDALYVKNLYKGYMIPPDKIPLIVSNTILAGYFFGDDGLAIVSFLMPLFFLFETIGFWINYGALAKCLDAIGNSETLRARSYSSLALSLTLASSVILAGVSLAALPSILDILGVPIELRMAVMDYGIAMVIACVFMMVALYCWQFVKVLGLQARIRIIYVPIMLVDVLVTVFCIKVLGFGIVSLSIGMIGANLFVIMKSVGWFRATFDKNLLGEIISPLESTAEIIASGSAPSMGKFYSLFILFGFNMILMREYGVHGVAMFAALQTAIRICRLHSQVTWQPIAPILTTELNDRNVPSAMIFLKHSLKQAFVMALLPALVIYFGADYFTSSLDESIRPFAIETFEVYSLSVVPAALTSIFIIALSTVNRRAIANVFELIRSLLLIAVFVKYTAPSMIFYSYPFAEVVSLALVAAYLFVIGKPENKSKLFMVIDRNAGLTTEDSARLEKVLPQSTLEFVKEWIEFTKQRSDKKKNNLTALHVIEENGETRLTFRSMGKLFDYRSDPKAEEMVKGLPGLVGYKFNSVLGLNNLYLRIGN